MPSFPWGDMMQRAGFGGILAIAEMQKQAGGYAQLATMGQLDEFTRIQSELASKTIAQNTTIEKTISSYAIIMTVIDDDAAKMGRPHGWMSGPAKDYDLYTPQGQTVLIRQGSSMLVGEFSIQFQFAPDAIEVNDQVLWAKVSTMGRDAPLAQFNANEARTLSFSTTLIAPTSWFPTAGDLYVFVRTLDGLKLRRPELGRPPVFNVSCGEMSFGPMYVTQLQRSYRNIYEGFISSPKRPVMEGVSFTRRIDRENTGGFSHVVEVRITCEAWLPDAIGSISPDKSRQFLSSSYRVLALPGDQWEHIAQRVYGSPALGEPLRRVFPKDLIPKEGTVYTLPHVERLPYPAVEPECIPLQRTEESLALLYQTSRSRLTDQYSGVL